MVDRRTQQLPFLLLTCILTLQVLLALRAATGPFTGDEPYYVRKAIYFYENHAFQVADPAEMELQKRHVWGTADWRPQGYPVLVALCSGGHFDPDTLRRRVTLLQSLSMAVMIMLTYRLVERSVHVHARLPVAIALAVSPWPFEFVSSIGPDSLVASIVAASLLMFGKLRERIFLPTLVMSTTLLLRPEMIVFPPMIVSTTVFLYREKATRMLLLGGSAFAIVLAAQIGYRIHFTGQSLPSIFGPLHIPDRGAFDWVNTWIGTEHEAYDFVYSLTNHEAIPPLPARAFSTQLEQREVRAILEHRSSEGHYSSADDESFERLARRRWREHRPTALIARLWHALSLWFNLETNHQFLNALSRFPGALRRSLLGTLLMLKLATLFSFGVFLVRVRRFGNEVFLVLSAVYVVARTIVIGLLMGWFAHRYVVSTWIPLMACACAALSPELLGRGSNLRRVVKAEASETERHGS